MPVLVDLFSTSHKCQPNMISFLLNYSKLFWSPLFVWTQCVGSCSSCNQQLHRLAVIEFCCDCDSCVKMAPTKIIVTFNLRIM